jgi:hypothetical protein
MRPSALLVFALLATAPALARHVLPAFSGPVRAVGDGAGVVRFELRWEGAAPQVEASAGEVAAVKPAGEGTWAVDFVPPRVAAPFEVVLRARGKKAKAARFVLRVEPAEPPVQRASGPLALTAPALLAGGRASRISVAAADEGLQLWVSGGSAGRFTRTGASLTAPYEPPREAYPQAVIAAVTDAGGELRDWAVLAVQGVGEVEAETEPRASVRFHIGGEAFGPVRTDTSGRTRMKVRAPPGHGQALAVVTDRLGNVHESRIDLGVPLRPRLLLLCPQRRDRVVLLAVGPDGAPARAGRFRFGVSGAEVGPVRELSPGHYEAPLHADARGALSVEASWEGQEAPASHCSLPAAPFRELGAQAPVARVSRFAVEPRLGYAATLGRFSAPLALVGASWRPEGTRWLAVGLEVGLARRFGESTAAIGGEALVGSHWMAPLLARGTVRPWTGPVSPYAGVLAGAVVVGGTTTSPRTGTLRVLRALPSAGAALGLEWPVGPGRLTGEAGYLRGFVPKSGPEGQLNAFLFSAGYRFER